ncbi:MAG: ABC transporter permease [Patescibacteria group bacterium]|jgi:ABC-2 type transport system permease protein
MKKFWVLLKKEVKELITPIMVVPLLATVVLFMGIGKVSDIEATKAKTQPIEIAVIDQDSTAASAEIITGLKSAKYIVNLPTDSVQNVLDTANSNKNVAIIIIPAGFGNNILSGTNGQIEFYSVVKSLSATASRNQQTVKAIIQLINEQVSNSIIKSQSSFNPNFVKQPIVTSDHIIVGDKNAPISMDQMMAVVQNQTYFIPIILFLVIIIAAQLIATSVATEKENKTLETLLSTPISRRAIVTAKLMAAGIVAGLFAVVYLIGMRSYMNGLSGGALTAGQSADVSNALHTLGLTFGTTQYILLGLTLFLGILCALAVALILGAFAEDAKSIQGIITPLMILVMIPYFLVLILDFNSLSPAIKWAVYAIPFAHPFLAVQAISLHQYSSVIYGIIYQAIVFVIFVSIAARIFSTDLIVTLKLNFNKKVKNN